MIEKSFLDTNILIYAFSGQGQKFEKAEQIFFLNPFISSQVINEFTRVMLDKFKLPSEEVLSHLNLIGRNCSIIPLNIELTRKALSLKEKYKYSWWDSLILAAALKAACKVLYTEDLHNGQIVNESLKIVNPFI